MGFLRCNTEGNGATRYGLSALNANDYDGEVNVNRNDTADLAIPNTNEGGRAVEAVDR